MPQVSNKQAVDLFKEVYGDLRDLIPDDFPLARDLPFQEKQKVGEEYKESIVLTNENGYTLAGSGYDAFEIEPAVAGTVKQTSVSPFIVVLPSVLPWAMISRSAGAGKKAFFEATRHVTRNNLKSHGKMLEVLRLHGQSESMLGYVSYATKTYRGVSFTDGTGTLSVNGTSVAFTNGVNTSEKAILLAPGQFAAGIWIGAEGMPVEQLDSSNNVVASGSVVEVDVDKGVIIVDFVPVAATSTTSHKLAFKGMAEQKEMIGVEKILTTSGNLFGINNSRFQLFKGNYLTLNNEKLKLENIQDGAALAVNRGGLDSDLKIYVNPRTLAKMITTEAGLRQYDSSYKVREADNGFESITFYAQNGKVEIHAHRIVKEGQAFGLCLKEWSRSGSAEISFRVPGMDQGGDLIFPLENQAGYVFRSYSDQYIFCYQPSKSIYWDGIDDEAAS